VRTITIQADGGPGGNDDVMRGALRYIVMIGLSLVPGLVRPVPAIVSA